MFTYLHRISLKSLILNSLILNLAFVAVISGSSFAQQSNIAQIEQLATTTEIAELSPLPAAPGYETLSPREAIMPAAGAMMIVSAEAQPSVMETHRFWDRENTLLFVGVGAAATADFFTTHANLASGGRELNPITRVLSGTTPGLATNFALETAGIMGVSYLFHKTGHHKLERMTSVVNISSSAFAVSYGLTHR